MRLRECCSILAFGVLACAVISWPVCRVAHDVMGVRVRSMHAWGASGPSAALRRRAWCRSRVGRARVGAARDTRRRRARRYLYNNLISSIASGAWTGMSSLTTLCVPRRSAAAACCCVMRLERVLALYLFFDFATVFVFALSPLCAAARLRGALSRRPACARYALLHVCAPHT